MTYKNESFTFSVKYTIAEEGQLMVIEEPSPLLLSLVTGATRLIIISDLEKIEPYSLLIVTGSYCP